MMQQQHPPPACGGAVHSSSMDQQQQQHQPQPTTTTTSTTTVQEEEEEDRKLWRGELQNWMDKVEDKEIRTLWIQNLHHWMDEAYIDSCFSHTGEVFTTKVIRNASSKSSSSSDYGFIEFKSHAIADTILQKFNGTPMPRVAADAGTKFTLNWASSFGSKEDDTDAADDDDKKLPKLVTPASLLPPGTPTPQPTDLSVNSGWEDTLKWWSIIAKAKETRTPQLVYAAHRVFMIGALLQQTYDRPPDEIIEELLDELLLHVASIDIAKALFWNEEPGVSAFGLNKGYEYLCSILDTHNFSSLCTKRKVVDLIARLVKEHNADYKIVIQLECPRLMMELVVESKDAEVQTTVLKCLLVLAVAEKDVNNGQVVEIGDTLKKFLQAGINGIMALSPPDRDHMSEVIQLVDLLWSTCYNESSSLGDLCPPSAAIPTS